MHQVHNLTLINRDEVTGLQTSVLHLRVKNPTVNKADHNLFLLFHAFCRI